MPCLNPVYPAECKDDNKARWLVVCINKAKDNKIRLLRINKRFNREVISFRWDQLYMLGGKEKDILGRQYIDRTWRWVQCKYVIRWQFQKFPTVGFSKLHCLSYQRLWKIIQLNGYHFRIITQKLSSVEQSD